MGKLVIVAYRPKPGKEPALLDCLRDHLPVLRKEGLATERPSLVMRAEDGAMVEVFEWASARAIEEAHRNVAVLALWERFGEACDNVALAELAEAKQLFAHFEPLEP